MPGPERRKDDSVRRRWVGRFRVALMGISGLFGHRSPPEPEVIPQMAPQQGNAGKAPPSTDRLANTSFAPVEPYRRPKPPSGLHGPDASDRSDESTHDSGRPPHEDV